MKGSAFLLAAALAATTTRAQQTVSVPWAEFSKLYRAQITREILDSLPQKKEDPVHDRASLDTAVYSLAIEGTRATGHLSLTGETLEGTPTLRLFSRQIVPSAITDVSGGRLDRTRDALVLHSTGPGPLTVDLEFLLTGKENNGQTTFTFDTQG